MASNAVEAACAANQWTAVAVNVQNVQVIPILSKPSKYMITYRLTGQAAPSGLDNQGAIHFSKMYEFDVGAAIDVYVYPQGTVGRVAVFDLT